MSTSLVPGRSSAITTYQQPGECEGPNRYAFEPNSMKEALELCAQLAGTGMLRVRTPQAAFLQIMLGREHGLTAMQSLMGIHVINNRPAMDTELLVAKVRASSVCEYLTVTESTNERCTVEAKRRGAPKPIRVTWTIEDAKRANLAGRDTWKQYPKRMLMWRALADAIKAEFQDVTMGLVTREEMIDVSPVREDRAPGLIDVTPPPPSHGADVSLEIPNESSPTEKLKQRLKASKEATEAEPQAELLGHSTPEASAEDPVAGGDEDEAMEACRAELASLLQDLGAVLEDEAKAKDLWKKHVGAGPAKTIKECRRRMQAAYDLKERAEIDAYLKKARQAIIAKLGDPEGAQRIRGASPLLVMPVIGIETKQAQSLEGQMRDLLKELEIDLDAEVAS